MEAGRYAIIEVEYEGLRETKKQRSLLSADMYLEFKEEIDSALNNCWISGMDGKHSHVQGFGYAEILDNEKLQCVLEEGAFYYAHELEELMLYNVNSKVAEDIKNTSKKLNIK